jgi:hypothetical protein
LAVTQAPIGIYVVFFPLAKQEQDTYTLNMRVKTNILLKIFLANLGIPLLIGGLLRELIVGIFNL